MSKQSLIELIDTKGTKRYIPLFAVEGLCDFLVNDLSQNHINYKKKYEEYQKKVTRFSSSFEFFIHELGWGLGESFITGTELIIDKNNVPLMSDEQLGFSSNLDIEKIDEGIIDENGFISFRNLHSKEFASTIILIESMINDKELCYKYMDSKEKNPNQSDYEFLVSLPNVVGIKKIGDKYSLNYAEANGGRVEAFIDYLKENDLLLTQELTQRETGSIIGIEEDDESVVPKM